MILAATLAIAIHLAPTAQDLAQPLPRRGSLGLSFGPVSTDLAKKSGLKPAEGIVVTSRTDGFTGEKAGLQVGDILLTMNGQAPTLSTIASMARELRAGDAVQFKISRDGKTLDLKAKTIGKPIDPGTDTYSVEYSQVVSNGKRMRTIITHPKAPGKHPVLYFIQGFSPVSYDFTLSTSTGDVKSLDGPILHEFANRGFVVMRVEKPGVGDSEGGPFAELDYITELDIYRQALKQIHTLPDADTKNIFIFGHSMGSAFGPMVAAESPVKGVAIYGGAARTWHEYILDTLRYQGLVAGGTFEAADDEVRVGSRVLALAFHEGKSAEQIKTEHPELKAYVDSLFPGGMFNGKVLEYWRQLAAINFPSYWVKAKTRILAVHGGSDFVTYDADHKLMADIANKIQPGWGKFVICPSSDHLFHNFATEPEAMRGYSKGTFNPAFTKIMMDWIKEVMQEKAN